MSEADGGIGAIMAGVSWVLGLLPVVLAIVGVIDVVRSGRSVAWLLLVLCVPVAGPLAYFLLTRGTWGSTDSRGSSSRRKGFAKSRLRDLEAQLQHWRGPGVLAEAGEELLTLERFREAEAMFREARERGASARDVNLGLAEALVAQGRLAEAVEPLRQVTAADPDHAMGRAQMLLARCLDQLDQRADAEAALREILKHRNTPEARVRLARLVILRGEDVVGRALAQDAVTDIGMLAAPMRRAQARWAKAGRRVAGGDVSPLRAPLLDDEPGPAWWPRLLLIGGLAVLGVVLAAVAGIGALTWDFSRQAERAESDLASRVRRLDEIEERAPWTASGDSASVVLQPAQLEAYLRLRAELAEARRSSMIADETVGGVPTPWEAGERLLAACETAPLSPQGLPALASVVDRRFLGRREAAFFELPQAARPIAADLVRRITWLRTVPPFDGDGRAEAQAQLDELLELAPSDTTLSPPTRTLLETRREDIERLDAGSLLDVIEGLADAAEWREWAALEAASEP